MEDNDISPLPRQQLPGAAYMGRKRLMLADRNGDPMESMGNLFDVAVLLGVGFLIMALSGIGMSDYLSKDKMTIVKNPGAANMEIITKEGNKVTRLKTTGQEAEGAGTAIGTVYKLQDGSIVWVPGTSAP
jgi:hypothetical protein